jgi:hypothetical protein
MRSANKYIVAASLLAASLAAYGQSSLSGKWHGTENNLPIVDLTIEKNASQATGAVVFYVIKRNTTEAVRMWMAKPWVPWEI